MPFVEEFSPVAQKAQLVANLTSQNSLFCTPELEVFQLNRFTALPMVMEASLRFFAAGSGVGDSSLISDNLLGSRVGSTPCTCIRGSDAAELEVINHAFPVDLHFCHGSPRRISFRRLFLICLS